MEVIRRVISPLIGDITIVALLITPRITTHEPPSMGSRRVEDGWVSGREVVGVKGRISEENLSSPSVASPFTFSKSCTCIPELFQEAFGVGIVWRSHHYLVRPLQCDYTNPRHSLEAPAGRHSPERLAGYGLGLVL